MILSGQFSTSHTLRKRTGGNSSSHYRFVFGICWSLLRHLCHTDGTGIYVINLPLCLITIIPPKKTSRSHDVPTIYIYPYPRSNYHYIILYRYIITSMAHHRHPAFLSKLINKNYGAYNGSMYSNRSSQKTAPWPAPQRFG